MDLTPDAFAARRRALEDAFFQQRDAELVKNIRSHLSEMEEKQKLTHVSGILDQQVLVDLVHAGVTAETLLAMRFVPMIGVAWSDRVVSKEERSAILQAAEAEDIAAGSPAHKLLEAWLENKPNSAVFTAWKEYVGALAQVMPAATLLKLRERTERLCHLVAKATGGILGVGSVSAAERAAIADFSASWGG
jgi:hypothetical protein